MSDIKEKLRGFAPLRFEDRYAAADEIERLRGLLQNLDDEDRLICNSAPEERPPGQCDCVGCMAKAALHGNRPDVSVRTTVQPPRNESAIALLKGWLADRSDEAEQRESLARWLADRAANQPAPVACPNGLTPDGPICPQCGGKRAPSGVDGGSWVHLPSANVKSPVCCVNWPRCECGETQPQVVMRPEGRGLMLTHLCYFCHANVIDGTAYCGHCGTKQPATTDKGSRVTP